MASSWWTNARDVALGAVLWSALIATSAALNITHWANEHHLGAMVTVFALGALPAVPVTMLAQRQFTRWLPRATQRFALAFLLLSTMTIGCTAFIFSQIQYQSYSELHGSGLLRWRVFEYVFTIASTFYQFAALGMRHYFPLGFAATFTFSLWLGLRAR